MADNDIFAVLISCVWLCNERSPDFTEEVEVWVPVCVDMVGVLFFQRAAERS